MILIIGALIILELKINFAYPFKFPNIAVVVINFTIATTNIMIKVDKISSVCTWTCPGGAGEIYCACALRRIVVKTISYRK